MNAAHDAFRDALHAVVRLVCGALMSLEGKDDVAEVHDSRAKVGRIWDIWHGVKGCYKEPLASSVAPPKNEPSSGFEEQVRLRTVEFCSGSSSIRIALQVEG